MSPPGYPPDPPLPPPGGPDDASFREFAAHIQICLAHAERALGSIDGAISDLDPAATGLSTGSVGTDNNDLRESVSAIVASARMVKDARLAAQAGIGRGQAYLRSFGL